jgi:tetratricopeptide (TPR) repeat protein
MLELAKLYTDGGQYTKAEALDSEALDVCRRVLDEHPYKLWALDSLATVYQFRGQHAKAEVLWRELLKHYREKLGNQSAAVASALSQLGANQLQQKNDAEAESLLRECLKILEQKLPDSWQRFSVRCLLGVALANQKKYAEAEPLLLSGYEGMKARAQTMPAGDKQRLSEALGSVVQFYDAWGKKDKADEWRKKLAPREENQQPSAR